MMFGYGSHWAFWQVGLMWIGMVAFWGLLIWAVYAFVNGPSRTPEEIHRCDDALHILDQRLARGEVDADEYQRLRGLIVQGDRTPVGTGGGR